MSYDIWLRAGKCSACGRRGEEPETMHPTYNLTPIFDLALTGEDLPNADTSEMAVVVLGHKTDRPRGLRLLSGKNGSDTVEWLEKALGHLKDPAMREQFRALEPDNGWGDLAGAIQVIEMMLGNARYYPNNVWEIQ